VTLARFYVKALDRTLDTMAVIAGLFLVFQVVSISVDVSLRYFFDAPIKAVISLNEWSLLYIAFLAAGWLQRESGHVRVDIVLNFLGRRGSLVADLFGIALGIAACLVLTWFGVTVTLEKFTTGVYDFFKLEDVPIWPVYLAIPLGSFLWLLQLLREGTQVLREHGRTRADPMTDL
jgi:TRAP-type C4-dicarboxylate transport system permease small subunit